jgi:hypothetical protein
MSRKLKDGIKKILSLFYSKVLKNSTVTVHAFESNDDDNDDNKKKNNNNNNSCINNRPSFLF